MWGRFLQHFSRTCTLSHLFVRNLPTSHIRLFDNRADVRHFDAEPDNVRGFALLHVIERINPQVKRT